MRKFICVKYYLGIEIGEIIKEEIDRYGRKRYFSKIKKLTQERALFYPYEIENSKNFSEIYN